MKKTLSLAAAAFALAITASPFALAEMTVMVGGAPMYPSKDIIDNTVFAPTNEAFAALPAGTVDTLLKPENKGDLTKVLTYHVVAAKADAAALTGMIQKDGGMHKITTVEGETLTASIENGKVVITDAKGGKAVVTQADVYQSNGVIHVVDHVLLP